MSQSGKGTIEVVVTTDTWNVGGRDYHEGDVLTIRASTLSAHVSAGRCVPVGMRERFEKIRAAQAKANEEARRLIAEAEAEAERAAAEAVGEALTLGPKE